MKRNVWNLPLAVGLVAGGLRWLDVLFFTNMESGFCTVGSVWLRYAFLVALGVVGFLMGQRVPDEGMNLNNSQPLMGKLAVVGGLVFLSAAILSFLRCAVSGFILVQFIQTIFSVGCGVWLLLLGMNWMNPAHCRPTGGAWGVIGGSILFYWLVLVRFMSNRSSFYRVQPAASIFEGLAILLFLTALGRMLLFPNDSSRRVVCRTGLWAFYLCTCWGLAQVPADLLYGTGGASEVALRVGMAVVGALGWVCANEMRTPSVIRLRRDASINEEDGFSAIDEL